MERGRGGGVLEGVVVEWLWGWWRSACRGGGGVIVFILVLSWVHVCLFAHLRYVCLCNSISVSVCVFISVLLFLGMCVCVWICVCMLMTVVITLHVLRVMICMLSSSILTLHVPSWMFQTCSYANSHLNSDKFHIWKHTFYVLEKRITCILYYIFCQLFNVSRQNGLYFFFIRFVVAFLNHFCPVTPICNARILRMSRAELWSLPSHSCSSLISGSEISWTL